MVDSQINESMPEEEAPAPPQSAAEALSASGDSAPSDYKIELESYAGPLDLLLYLIRKEEVDIYDIPIARITQQYLTYLEVITELDVNVAGEFVVMAATLLEIKARMMAPDPVEAEEEEEAGEDPRLELVRQLIEYRMFKEAAIALGDRAEARLARFSRPGERVNEKGEHVQDAPSGVDVWMLLEAFSRVLAETGRGPHRVRLDLLPQAELNANLENRLKTNGRIKFFDAFTEHHDRAMVVGMFFAVLELAKRQILRAEQDEPFADIWLTFVPEEEREAVVEEPEPDEGAEAPRPTPLDQLAEEPADSDDDAFLGSIELDVDIEGDDADEDDLDEDDDDEDDEFEDDEDDEFDDDDEDDEDEDDEYDDDDEDDDEEEFV